MDNQVNILLSWKSVGSKPGLFDALYESFSVLTYVLSFGKVTCQRLKHRKKGLVQLVKD